jgi:hypothetical protein
MELLYPRAILIRTASKHCLRGTINALRPNLSTKLAAMTTIPWIWMEFIRLKDGYDSLRLQSLISTRR